jgi:hypothetical protein
VEPLSPPGLKTAASLEPGGICKSSAAREHTYFRPGLVPNFSPKFYYAKRRFSVTSKYRHMYIVLNVDEIKN